jgi:hypothetical protein
VTIKAYNSRGDILFEGDGKGPGLSVNFGTVSSTSLENAVSRPYGYWDSLKVIKSGRRIDSDLRNKYLNK